MTATSNGQLSHWVGLAARAFILASVVAVILPLPHYARCLGHSQYIIWVARLAWVLLLSAGSIAVLLLVGFFARQRVS